MIELLYNTLRFTFPEVHPNARMRIRFERTLRVPDDGRDYPAPPGLGLFPLRHVDDFAERLPAEWIRHGGVVLPMYPSEAMWLEFDSPGYPLAIKVGTGKINAVTGQRWREGLNRAPQDYVTVPKQKWLDGYCVEKGRIRQFVAMPLGAGYTAEEQITGAAEHGGLQIAVYPLKREAWERIAAAKQVIETMMMLTRQMLVDSDGAAEQPPIAMGLGAGGRMLEEIFKDPYDVEDWDLVAGNRCFVHILNTQVWRSITGTEPPTSPPTAKEYRREGLPWFDYYADDGTAVEASSPLLQLKGIVQLGKEMGDIPLPENESVETNRVIDLKHNTIPGAVRKRLGRKLRCVPGRSAS